MSLDELVSVVIPVYNSENFLAESIESVLNQTYENIEIIAVDDGSTDNSLKILQKYEDKITTIHHENQGLANSVNEAISKINGRWLKWLSPDDVLYPEAIEVLVNVARNLPENIILYSNWELIDKNNKKLRDFSESNYNDLGIFDFNVRLLDGQQININTTLIPHSIFKNGCLFRQLEDTVAIDYDFFLRAGIIYNFHFHLIEKILLKYRIHGNQLSHKNIAKTLSFLSEMRSEVLSKLTKADKENYLKALEKYNKTKSLSKKTMELGLKFVTILPEWASDRLVVFYLNKIRRSR